LELNIIEEEDLLRREIAVIALEVDTEHDILVLVVLNEISCIENYRAQCLVVNTGE
jgi:hypothetical protein